MTRAAAAAGFALVFALGRAAGQDAGDPAAAVQSGSQAEAVGAARDSVKSLVGKVFGGGAGAPPAPPAPPAPAQAGAPLQPVAPPALPPAAGAAGAPVGVPAAGAAGAEAGAPVEEAMTPPAVLARGRDPFRPFTFGLRETQEDELLTPLQRLELRQLRLAGVVLDLKPPRAMLQDASGMGFIVVPGTPIGRRHGVVKAIEAQRVIVEERVLDYYGREQVSQVVIEMPKETKPRGAGQE